MTRRGPGLPGRLRIVGGVWRGRRLAVLDQPGLRPTPDRVRETLFNWLAPLITGARCLDLYAGSGALGFEAASRGADRVVMVEKMAKVVRVLHENRLVLNARQVEVIQAEAGPWLATAGHAEPFDLVFLDPPFSEDLLGPSCAALAQGGWLARGARVYLEASAMTGFPALPEGWRLLRDKQAGQVRYGLAETR
ncbi:MAG: 16S rRNA (guanine(966)-N(2))-methyltransferase RsmD [Chromatiaceae bacterium]